MNLDAVTRICQLDRGERFQCSTAEVVGRGSTVGGGGPLFATPQTIRRYLAAVAPSINPERSVIACLGCGHGRESLCFAAALGCRVVGYDLNATCVERARAFLHHVDRLHPEWGLAGRVTFECRDVMRLSTFGRAITHIYSACVVNRAFYNHILGVARRNRRRSTSVTMLRDMWTKSSDPLRLEAAQHSFSYSLSGSGDSLRMETRIIQ